VEAPVGVVTGGCEGEGRGFTCVGRRLGSSTHHGEPPEVERFEASRPVEHVNSLVRLDVFFTRSLAMLPLLPFVSCEIGEV
jgi:hypothetical protein